MFSDISQCLSEMQSEPRADGSLEGRFGSVLSVGEEISYFMKVFW